MYLDVKSRTILSTTSKTPDQKRPQSINRPLMYFFLVVFILIGTIGIISFFRQSTRPPFSAGQSKQRRPRWPSTMTLQNPFRTESQKARYCDIAYARHAPATASIQSQRPKIPSRLAPSYYCTCGMHPGMNGVMIGDYYGNGTYSWNGRQERLSGSNRSRIGMLAGENVGEASDQQAMERLLSAQRRVELLRRDGASSERDEMRVGNTVMEPGVQERLSGPMRVRLTLRRDLERDRQPELVAPLPLYQDSRRDMRIDPELPVLPGYNESLDREPRGRG
ncbi:hypothetical protein B0O99DRAFT_670869 [Bisporella sp. PMI_857]|nr:hypothetical protein B0O99DRAFT_670869 [Bisporella sp. PMI_857]